jgi:hypothetical protein
MTHPTEARPSAMPLSKTEPGLTSMTRVEMAIAEVGQALYGTPEGASIKAPNLASVMARRRAWLEAGAPDRDAAA